ncbi:MAG: hypothetical protein H6644_15060 [Caldilineaceae bacterium]|nr:hypothetical protein [Caldilineaceae bacterium]
MVSPRFRIAALIVTLLLAVLLIFVVRLTLNTARPLAATPVPRALATATPAATSTSGTETASLAAPPAIATMTPVSTTVPEPEATVDASPAVELTQVAGGGFAYRAPDGFAVTTGETSVTLIGPTSSAELAPIFLLSGGPQDQFVTAGDADLPLGDLFDSFVAFFAEQDNFAVDNRRAVTVDGAPGFSVDLVSAEDDAPFAGRIVMAQPTDDRLFVMTGVAPLAKWEEGDAAIFDDVLASVTLTRPAVSASAFVLPTPTTRATVASTLPPTLPPTATPIPTSQALPTPDPAATRAAQLVSYANANMVRDLALTTTAAWAATDGGIVAWNHGGGFVKFAVDNGLALNHFRTVAYCPLPGLGVVFGTDGGLQIFDPRTGTWNTLNSANSAMSFDDVSVVECNVDDGFLTIGYSQHGLDFFDVADNAWTHVDRNDGLADDFVDHVAVVGDRDEVWVASGFSLTLLSNGRSVTQTSGNSPLQGAPINALLATSDRTIWVAQPAALHAIRGQEWTTYTANTAGAAAFPVGTLSALAAGDDGALWLGSAAGEVCRFDPTTARCAALYDDGDGLPALAVTALAAEGDQVYAATAGGGVSVFDGTSWRQRDVPGEVLVDNRIRSLAQDANGFVWIAGEQGVQQMHPLDPVIARLRRFGTAAMPLDGVQTSAADYGGGVWFGGLGAAYFDEDDAWTVYSTADGLVGGVVQAIAVDPQLRVWIGSKTGLSIRNGEDFFNLTRENGLPSDNILALLPQADVMWIGSNGGGLYRFAANQLRIFNQAETGLPSNTVTALAETGDGALLVGTDRGLARFQDETVTPIADVPSVPITAIATDGDRAWVATAGDGLYTFDGSNWRHRSVNGDLPSLHVSALLVDSYGTLWIGGESGGIVREPIPPSR